MSGMLPSRGEVWLVDLDPRRGHEQSGMRPAPVVAVDTQTQRPADPAILVPITTRHGGIPFHVSLEPGGGGLSRPSLPRCEEVRSVSRERLVRHMGQVLPDTTSAVEHRLRFLLGL